MPHKQVLFRSAAREKILRGATQLCDAVRGTLGPKSKSVLIQKSWGSPIVCNDGVTIAKEFDLKDPEENLGAQVLRQAAEKTGDAAGALASQRVASAPARKMLLTDFTPGRRQLTKDDAPVEHERSNSAWSRDDELVALPKITADIAVLVRSNPLRFATARRANPDIHPRFPRCKVGERFAVR